MKIMILFILNYITQIHANFQAIPIGLIYDETTSIENLNIIDLSIQSLNKQSPGLEYFLIKQLIKSEKNENTTTTLIIKKVHDLISHRPVAIFGSFCSPLVSVIESITNVHRIPYISWSNSGSPSPTIRKRFKNNKFTNRTSFLKSFLHENPKDLSYIISNRTKLKPVQLFLKPKLGPVLVNLINHFNWTVCFYIYNHEDAKVNIDVLNNFKNYKGNLLLRKINKYQNIESMLKSLKASPYKKIKIILDLDTVEDYLIFLKKIQDMDMNSARYHYILTYLGITELNLEHFKYSDTTINGFSIVNYSNPNTIRVIADVIQSLEPLNKMKTIPYKVALLIDGLLYFNKVFSCLIESRVLKVSDAVRSTRHKKQTFFIFKETQNSIANELLIREFKTSRKCNISEGLTGTLHFDRAGNRKKFNLEIYEIKRSKPLSKVATYSSLSGFKTNRPIDTQQVSGKRRKNHLIVISIKDDPFLMERKEGKNFTGNDRYIGYCADLTERISKMLNFTYEFRMVKDSKFGSKDSNGNWNGMVGELVRNEGDLAVAPLSISSAREMAIDFSMPFMYIGISIMIKKPKKERPGVFSFMTPINKNLWFCVVIAYISVSCIMYFICKLSPYNWQYDTKSKPYKLKNDFSLKNTLWFTLAALLQQGVDYSPKSLSGRLLASSWWFFTLILISSYTANLAAFLTVESIVSPIESAEDLAKQSEIQYGSVDGGSTQAFFRNSKVPTYKEMWTNMKNWENGVFVNNNQEGVKKVRNSKGKYAFLMESSVIEYLNEMRPCDTMKVGKNLDSKGYGIATPLYSDLSRPVHLAVLQLTEEGYLDELKRRWWYDRSECGATKSRKDGKRSLNLVNVTGIFYILIVGLLLSMLISTLELFYKTRKKSDEDKVRFMKTLRNKVRASIVGSFENHE